MEKKHEDIIQSSLKFCTPQNSLELFCNDLAVSYELLTWQEINSVIVVGVW